MLLAYFIWEQTGGIINEMQVLDFIAQAQGLALQDTKNETHK